MNLFLGIDVGSVSTNIVLLDESEKVKEALYLRTYGQPIETVKKGLQEISKGVADHHIKGVGVTGSARKIIGMLLSADVVKNEITAHAVSAIKAVPDAATVIEIGGQDSKIIIIRDGFVRDFAMNSVCAAGTGSFLDQQASRLGIKIEDFGELAKRAGSSVRIAGRCAVFAESDMVHKQQMGAKKEEIIKGLCEALARNFLSSVAKGKDILSPVVFQGGVAANEGMREAFKKELECDLIVPEHFMVMGAIGAAMLAKEKGLRTSKFRGFSVAESPSRTKGFDCSGCPNACEIVNLEIANKENAYLGGRCGKWEEK